MDKEFFLNSVIPPPLHFEPTWQSLSSSMEISASELNCSPEQSSECFSNPSWQKSTDRGIHFYSALSSFISSPMAPNSAISTDSYMIRELIGKLSNNIGLSGEISPTSHPLLGNSVSMVTSNSPNTSCSTPLNSTLVDLTADPGFAERAARFSCFGSRSFNGRTSQLGLNSGELPYRSSPSSGNGKLTRVLSSPSLKALGSQLGKLENNKSPSLQRIELEIGSATSDQAEFANSRDESTVSVQNPGDSNPSWGLNSRKRKAMSRGKAREIGSNLTKNDDSTAKRCRSNKSNGNENGGVKEEEKEKGISGDDPHEQGTPPEPPKDYIHVRARRGQATDSHSLAERVRREKISERMKLLQDLVPGCNKVTGKALMLDEIINYVQSLQRQVEFLSMKLASVNFQSDSSSTTDHHLPEMLQSSCPNTLSAYQLESCAPALYESHPQQNRSSSQCSMDPLNAAICQNLSTQLPLLDGFCGGLHQFQSFGEDDLQSVVQMGFGKHLNPSSRTKHLC